jgi:hypothetical protein
MGELRCARSVCLPLVLSAARHCVRRHAGHVTERPRLGFPFARSAVAEVNYSYVQIGPAILRRHPITGGVQRGNSVTHSVAYATRNWRFDSGRPAGLNNLRRAAFKLSRAMTPRGLYKIAPSQQWPHSSERLVLCEHLPGSVAVDTHRTVDDNANTLIERRKAVVGQRP